MNRILLTVLFISTLSSAQSGSIRIGGDISKWFHIAFGWVPVDKTKEQKIFIYNPDKADARIDSIRIPSDVVTFDPIQFPIVLEKDDSLKIHLRFKPKKMEITNTTLKVYGNSIITIQILGYGDSSTTIVSLAKGNQWVYNGNMGGTKFKCTKISTGDTITIDKITYTIFNVIRAFKDTTTYITEYWAIDTTVNPGYSEFRNNSTVYFSEEKTLLLLVNNNYQAIVNSIDTNWNGFHYKQLWDGSNTGNGTTVILKRTTLKGVGVVSDDNYYERNKPPFPYVREYSYYGLIGARIDGKIYGDKTVLTNINSDNAPFVTPVTLTLKQNYPNPFNPTTTIDLSVPVRSYVTLKIFDLIGREVSTLMSEELLQGEYSTTWDGTKYPSGIYFCRLQSGNIIQTKKLILQK